MHEKAVTVPADEVVFDSRGRGGVGAKARARGDFGAATLARPEWAARRVAVRVNAPGSEELGDDLALIRTAGRVVRS